jgi:hypothetical protein
MTPSTVKINPEEVVGEAGGVSHEGRRVVHNLASFVPASGSGFVVGRSVFSARARTGNSIAVVLDRPLLEQLGLDQP